jgi:hypothetical protein
MAAVEAVLGGALEMRRQLLAVTPRAIYLWERSDRRLSPPPLPLPAAGGAFGAAAGSPAAAAPPLPSPPPSRAQSPFAARADGRRDARGAVVPRGSSGSSGSQGNNGRGSTSTSSGSGAGAQHYGGQEGKDPVVGKPLPALVLRRRVALEHLEGLTLSKQVRPSNEGKWYVSNIKGVGKSSRLIFVSFFFLASSSVLSFLRSTGGHVYFAAGSPRRRATTEQGRERRRRRVLLGQGQRRKPVPSERRGLFALRAEAPLPRHRQGAPLYGIHREFE